MTVYIVTGLGPVRGFSDARSASAFINAAMAGDPPGFWSGLPGDEGVLQRWLSADSRSVISLLRVVIEP